MPREFLEMFIGFLFFVIGAIPLGLAMYEPRLSNKTRIRFALGGFLAFGIGMKLFHG